MSFFCAGAPTTQGSKRGFIVNGRVVLVESTGERLKDWRHVLAIAARDAWPHPPLTGAVSAEMHFTLPKPKSTPKRKRTWPIGKRSGDLDKLERAVFDAITHVIVADDAQVIDVRASKDWEDASEGPGVLVLIREVTA